MKIGKLSEAKLNKMILQPLRDQEDKLIQGPGVGHDYAETFCAENFSMVTASATIAYDIAQPEYYAIEKAVNKLLTSGVSPEGIYTNLLFPVKTNEIVVADTAKSIRIICKQQGFIIYGGHTELSNAVIHPVIQITAYGKRKKQAPMTPITSGQMIIMTKWAGLEATAMLAKRNAEELYTRYPRSYIDAAADFTQFLSIRPEIEALESDTKLYTYIHDISTGGVFSALWEIGRMANVGMQVDLKAIPIKQETVEIAEFYNVNPYMLLGGGSALIVTDNDQEVLAKLQQKGVAAKVIGTIHSTQERVIINEDDKRFLTPPKGDELYKIL